MGNQLISHSHSQSSADNHMDPTNQDSSTSNNQITKYGDPTERPPKIKHKFLRRTLILDAEDEAVLMKVRMKGLHLKEIYELEKGEGELPYELHKHQYLKKKYLNATTSIQIASSTKLHWLNQLKNAKNATCIVISLGKEDFEHVLGFPNTDAKIEFVLQCLRKLSKKIKEFKISIEGLSVKKGHMQAIYRILGSMRELKIFWRTFGFQKPERYLEKEYKLINRYLPRIKTLEEFQYDYWRYEKECWANDEMIDIGENTRIDQLDFQQLTLYSEPCPYVTNLTLNVVGEFFRTFQTVQNDLEEELSESNGENKTRRLGEQWEDEDSQASEDDDSQENSAEEDDDDEGSEEEWNDEDEDNNNPDNAPPADVVEFGTEEEKRYILYQEIKPFYRFDLFPNVKNLMFQTFDDCVYPLDTFVVDGFRALKQLEFLDLTIEARPVGTHFLFDGLMELSKKLQKFSLEIKFLKEKEWALLDAFFEKQDQLKSITLIIPSERSTKQGFLTQSQHFENTYKWIENKPNLQYLDLRSLYCSLESLSKALGKTTMVNQLKLLGVEAIDDMGITPSGPKERVEGLCDFIKRQKESLLYLTVSIPYVYVPEIMENVAEAISQVKSLRELELYINYVTETTLKEYSRFFERILKKDNPLKVRRKTKNTRSWYPAIAEMLKKLENLDDLTMYFGLSDEVEEKWSEEYFGIIREIPQMKSLWTVEFNLPFSNISRPFTEDIQHLIYDMRNVSSITLDTDDVMNEGRAEMIERVVEEVNLRQSLRCDYLF